MADAIYLNNHIYYYYYEQITFVFSNVIAAGVL